MNIFRNFNNKKYYYNIYGFDKNIKKRKIIILIFIIIILLVLICIIIINNINTKKMLIRKRNFENQILEYVNQKKITGPKEVKVQIEEERIPKLTENSKEKLKNIYQSETKIAFLTFDDGPSTNTEDILNILKEKNIKATFFVLGNQVERMPQILKRVYKEGHYIANHGYSHVYSSIYATPEEVLNEYNRTNELVKRAIEKPEYNTYIFRFPGGSVGGKYSEVKQQAINLLNENNILYVDWNALTGDSEKQDPTEEYLMNNLQNTTQDKNSAVILMHDSQNKRITVDFLPKVIDYLKEQGYSFANFYKIME